MEFSFFLSFLIGVEISCFLYEPLGNNMKKFRACKNQVGPFIMKIIYTDVAAEAPHFSLQMKPSLMQSLLFLLSFGKVATILFLKLLIYIWSEN